MNVGKLEFNDFTNLKLTCWFYHLPQEDVIEESFCYQFPKIYLIMHDPYATRKYLYMDMQIYNFNLLSFKRSPNFPYREYQ